MSTNPPYHTRIINDRDNELEKRLKPLIRLVKYWNVTNGNHLRSFHVEMMVWRMWRSRNSLPSFSAAVAQSIAAMRGWLKSPFDDPWAGTRIDSYLSSEERAQVIRMLDSDATAAAKAEEYRRADKIEKAFERWSVVFRQDFPAYG